MRIWFPVIPVEDAKGDEVNQRPYATDIKNEIRAAIESFQELVRVKKMKAIMGLQ